MHYLVVHAHLYQPPRENPWSETITRQPSAAPFHDWNERVSDECYERLGCAAVSGPAGEVVSVVNLFGRISFNIGPTLATWLQRERPEVLLDAKAGIEAAVARTGGCPALMQPYGHSILPLANRQEKRLLIAWGRDDFTARFGRAPRGVWLPETAVDLETLEVCADLGLEFTILAPEQILRVRPLGGSPEPLAAKAKKRRASATRHSRRTPAADDSWEDVSGGRCPTHRPLLVRLPSGRTFTVFVFHGGVSRDAAFAGTLSSSERFLDSVRHALSAIPDSPGMLMLASDGETFGHHQRGAEGVLAEGLVRCRLSGLAQVTHLEELIAVLPPTHEAQIATPSAWSCAHGVGRWMRDCGCRMSHPPGWNQEWRAPLRSAVVSLRDRVFSLIEREGRAVFEDPWAALEAFGPLLAAPPTTVRLSAFVAEHAASPDVPFERAATLLELVRQVLFSATSCGWFFDDIAGIEAVQVLRHAGRAAELCRSVFGVDPEPLIVKKLADARPNAMPTRTGADVYLEHVGPGSRHEPMALAVHGLGRLREVMRSPATGRSGTSETLGGISTEFGLFGIDEDDPPGITAEPGGILRVEGRGVVTDRRCGRTWQGRYAVWSERPGRPVVVEIDDKVVDDAQCVFVAERALALGAARAASLLPAPNVETLRDVAWATRSARRLGTPLPSPFLEAIVGGARGLLAAELERSPVSLEQEVRHLVEPLEAGLSAGVRAEELAGLRPALDRRLALLVHWVLMGDFAHVVGPLNALLTVAREAMGADALNRTRRALATVALERVDRRALLALGRTLRLAPDVWTPLDIPARKLEEAVLDDVV